MPACIGFSKKPAVLGDFITSPEKSVSFSALCVLATSGFASRWGREIPEASESAFCFAKSSGLVPATLAKLFRRVAALSCASSERVALMPA